MLFENLVREAHAVSSRSLTPTPTSEAWAATLDERRRRWRFMLGLEPLPERTPIHATCTGELDRGDYVVEKIHFQCMPGAHVAGNIYRPAKVDGPMPAVLYLCGHSKGKVNPPYQANPRWFGQHGYVALVLDPIQLGECQGYHNGTYQKGRFDWFSRGYTPAGTEVWIAMRALDYLQERDDVDGSRMGVTGLSGGGVISWCLGATDERVKAVVPVCQSGTIEQVVKDRSMDGHCDCAFWVNTFGWCWPDVGALIAPRALLVASGTEDVLWRPYAFRDVVHRLRFLYGALGAPGNVDLVEDLTPHGYTPKLRKGIFEWFNRHLKDSDEPVTDDVTEHIEPEENLLVFGGKLPENDTMATIDLRLVTHPEPALPAGAADWPALQAERIERLRSLTFRRIPAKAAPAQIREVRADGSGKVGADGQRVTVYRSVAFASTDGLPVRLVQSYPQPASAGGLTTVLCALDAADRSTFMRRPGVAWEFGGVVVEVRGTGALSIGAGLEWTARRAYPLVGSTLPERQVADLLAAAQAVREVGPDTRLVVYGKGATAVAALYAAVLDPTLDEVILEQPPASHGDANTPELLNVLHTGDIAQNLALVHPRPITFVGDSAEAYDWTRRCYEAVGSSGRIRQIDSLGAWRPFKDQAEE